MLYAIFYAYNSDQPNSIATLGPTCGQVRARRTVDADPVLHFAYGAIFGKQARRESGLYP